jgi:GxxExxY protein
MDNIAENEIGTIVVDEAVKLHQALGPGLLEIVYEAVLTRRLRERGLKVERQKPIRIEYQGERFDEGFRTDIIVNRLVIIELKSVEKVSPVHKKQLLTYLRLTNLKVGYLLNFGDYLMKDGISRIINGRLQA